MCDVFILSCLELDPSWNLFDSVRVEPKLILCWVYFWIWILLLGEVGHKSSLIWVKINEIRLILDLFLRDKVGIEISVRGLMNLTKSYVLFSTQTPHALEKPQVRGTRKPSSDSLCLSLHIAIFLFKEIVKF